MKLAIVKPDKTVKVLQNKIYTDKKPLKIETKSEASKLSVFTNSLFRSVSKLINSDLPPNPSKNSKVIVMVDNEKPEAQSPTSPLRTSRLRPVINNFDSIKTIFISEPDEEEKT